ncbi:NADH:flavin oxidoreductase/NADH oxidase [Planctomonas psychrotolerans]|uniref:NADH:flavin oxidoreductase/NADH oxidase n=1 Tax=Planctomonas psychrotolerans TaxID=2528712 RepID=UPI001238BA38|nr:NADH:flavin oxidoreductase/NADH oxidase [Planctomonas psychrotolerans]
MPESALFAPLSIRGMTTRNRIWVAPMCQYSVYERDGVPTNWHLVHLGGFAIGGAGLVMTEAAAVSPEGRISPEDVGIWTGEQRDAWRPIVDFVHEQGAPLGIQLAHAGRKASVHSTGGRGTVPLDRGGWRTVGPSATAFPGLDAPAELDVPGIDAIVTDFASAAARSVEAGFDLVEIHAAHGYLVHQFLSPLSNRRTDDYGGSLENRARLLLRIVSAVRDAVGDTVPVFVRFSATDWTPDGWDEEQTATVTGWAKSAGADFFDISTGGNVPADIPTGPGYQVPHAEHVKRRTGARLNAVGLITTARHAEEIVASGSADAVMIAREMLRDPHFALRAAHELGVTLDYWPHQYARARWAESAS